MHLDHPGRRSTAKRSVIFLAVLLLAACEPSMSIGEQGTDGSSAGDPWGNDEPFEDTWVTPYLPEEPIAEPPADCTCAVEQDVCWDSLRCSRPEHPCSPIEACSPGYNCIDSTCVCRDLEICGVECIDDGDCGERAECDESTNRCRHEMSCLDDSTCAAGQRCLPLDLEVYETFDDIGWAHRVCTDLGEGQLGEPCTRASECASGACLEVCTTPCDSDTDCGEGLVCGLGDEGLWVCGLSTWVCTAASCNPDGSCQTQADCPADTRCDRMLDAPAKGVCADWDSPCARPDEFGWNNGHVDGPDDLLCFLEQPCWSNDDCPDGYGCRNPITVGDRFMWTGFCARYP